VVEPEDVPVDVAVPVVLEPEEPLDSSEQSSLVCEGRRTRT
jgi:hypothetical protein